MKTLTKKKHFLLLGAGMLSLAVAGSVGAIAASADTITGPSSTGTTTVTYTAADEWTVSIPDTLDIKTPNSDADKVTASGVNLEDGKSLTVTVNSKNEWHLRKAEQQEGGIEYELKVGGSGSALANGSTVLTVASGNTSGEAALNATIKDGKSPSTGGNAYTDTLTFTVAAQ